MVICAVVKCRALSAQPGWRFTGDLVMQKVFKKAGISESNPTLGFSCSLEGALCAFQRLRLQVAAPGKATLISGFSCFNIPTTPVSFVCSDSSTCTFENATKIIVLVKLVLSWCAVLSRISEELWNVRERPILPDCISQCRDVFTCHLFQAGNSTGEVFCSQGSHSSTGSCQTLPVPLSSLD